LFKTRYAIFNSYGKLYKLYIAFSKDGNNEEYYEDKLENIRIVMEKIILYLVLIVMMEFFVVKLKIERYVSINKGVFSLTYYFCRTLCGILQRNEKI
jgi:hypothetical protein